MSRSGDLGKADIHIHTAIGDGMFDIDELLDYVEEKTDLDVIAITDHDNINGAHAARELWAKSRYSFEVVAGVEVTAIEGHLLALYVEELPPPLRPVAEVLEDVHRQGGLCVIAHPLDWLTRSLNQRTIERIMRMGGDGVYFDGMEVRDGTLLTRRSVNRANKLNRERYHLAEVGGSDAHFLAAVGSAYTLFPGATANDLRRAILDRQSTAASGHHPSFLEIGPRQIACQAWRGLLVTPRTLGWGPTAKSFVKRIFPFLP
ncbi:MAG: PHP-associated domain-containing protein [Dehalococcoidia bacterium]